MGQLDALVFKNTALIVRQRKSLVLQVLAIIVLLLLGGVFNLFSPRDRAWRSSSSSHQYDGTVSRSCIEAEGTPQRCGEPYWGLFVNPSKGAKLGDDPAGTLTRDSVYTGDNSGALGNIPQYWADVYGYNGEEEERYFAPFFEEASSSSNVNKYFTEEITEQAESDSWFDTKDAVPNLAYLFDGISYEEGSLSYTLQMESVGYGRGISYEFDDYDGNLKQYAMSSLFQGFVEEAWGKNVTVRAQAVSMATHYWTFGLDITPLLVYIVVTPALMLLLPIFVLPIVIERGNKILSLNKLMGMKLRYYWLSYFICDYAIYFIQVVFVVGMMSIFLFKAIWTSGFVTVPLFLLWGVTQVCLGMFIAGTFSGERTATLVAYLITFLCIISGYPLNLWTFATTWASWWYYLLPPWVYMRGFYLIELALLNNDPITLFHNIFSEIMVVFIVLMLQAIVLAALAVYLEQVMPTSWGHRRPLLFPFYSLLHMIKKPAPYHYEPKESTGLLATSALPGQGEDVAQERELALRSDPTVHVMSCVDIRKEFGGKAAIDDLSLTVEFNETLGLLGSNGAGKTTLLSILSGMLMPSSGSALVGGYDVAHQADLVQQAIGICPQFDILWDDLTVNEHLRFYFRMKGNRRQDDIVAGGILPIDDYDGEAPEVPNLLEDAAQMKKPLHVRVSDLADLVGLSEHLNKTAKSLSGGNRRKLSIAIALVGDPKLVMLDEPSTGLDPEARREIWDIINEAREGRSFIITTHNMEECDTLATKIAIMTHGKLACVGTQQNLKSRFGKGYSLTVTCQAGLSEKEVHTRLVGLMPELQLEYSNPGQLHYLIDKVDFNISHVFTIMRENKVAAGVQDYGLAQASLEEVFLKIVELEDARREELGANAQP